MKFLLLLGSKETVDVVYRGCLPDRPEDTCTSDESTFRRQLHDRIVSTCISLMHSLILDISTNMLLNIILFLGISKYFEYFQTFFDYFKHNFVYFPSCLCIFKHILCIFHYTLILHVCTSSNIHVRGGAQKFAASCSYRHRWRKFSHHLQSLTI